MRTEDATFNRLEEAVRHQREQTARVQHTNAKHQLVEGVSTAAPNRHQTRDVDNLEVTHNRPLFNFENFMGHLLGVINHLIKGSRIVKGIKTNIKKYFNKYKNSYEVNEVFRDRLEIADGDTMYLMWKITDN